MKRKSADSKSLSSSFPLVYMWCVCFTCVLIAYLFTTNLKISEVNFPPNEQIFRKKIFTCVIRAFLFRSKRVATSFSALLRVPLVSLLSCTSASAARCAFVRVSQSLCREEIRARVYLFTCETKQKYKKKSEKESGVSVLLHVRPHRSIQAHRAIGTGVCVDPIARLMCCLLRAIRK